MTEIQEKAFFLFKFRYSFPITLKSSWSSGRDTHHSPCSPEFEFYSCVLTFLTITQKFLNFKGKLLLNRKFPKDV